MEDFERFIGKAEDLGLLVAMDIAFQAAPDHPYVKEHEAWFKNRPDGTIQYAENPPKKYQDIYPFDFESEDWEGMWKELKSVFDYWVGMGVTIFGSIIRTRRRSVLGVGDPEIKGDHPEVLFLAEAFTRPKIMYRLAKLGFSQSYTYFPWRNTKWGADAVSDGADADPGKEFFRPNQWPNTPDICTSFCRSGRTFRFYGAPDSRGDARVNYALWAGLGVCRAYAARAWQRGISELGEVRGQALQFEPNFIFQDKITAG